VVLRDPALAKRGVPIADDYLENALWVINSASHSLLVGMFLVNLDPNQDRELRVRRLVRALCDATWRKVRVQVLLSVPQGLSQRRSNRIAAHFLNARGSDVRELRSRSHHLKFLVADRKWSIVGSHNWTPPALGKNFELSMLITDDSVSTELSGIFLKLWDECDADLLNLGGDESGANAL
jgi:phosphatidylserine/phosphatidylglycerophosphate/cardiolipin synthase-like enzyme